MTFKTYINLVIDEIGCDKDTAVKIREDLHNILLEKQAETGRQDPEELLGKVKDVAQEFKENLGITGSPNNRLSVFHYGYDYGYEYKSKTQIAGVPLVHINGRRLGVAKGIIAVGSISIGVISLGGVSIGILSLGGLALGILSLGGIALGIFSALGGIAASIFLSLGGIAVSSYCSFGGLALAKLAIGGEARGIIAVYLQHGVGQYTFPAPLENIDTVMQTIRTVFPEAGKAMLKLIENLIRLM